MNSKICLLNRRSGQMPRIFEFVIALFGTIVLLPFFLFIAVLLKLNSKGPILYRAERAGQNGKAITVFKFRTMIREAEKCGPPITTQNDRRITTIGKFLRRTKLDELPQLLNILKGDMRFVGPRPEDPGIVEKYTMRHKKILKYKPGITSPASIAYRAEEHSIPHDQWEEIYQKEILSNKIAIDLGYLQNANFWSDILVVLETIGIKKRKYKK